MAGGLEMVRVRVLFLEPGNKIHPSLLDNCLTDRMIEVEDCRDWCPEDYEAEDYFTISKLDFADSINVSIHGGMLSSPNDPVVEMLKPLTVLYFDLLENNADWETGNGAICCALENISLWDEFGKYAADFIAYARTLTSLKNVHKSDYGTKVQFLTMWRCWSDQDYFGEWDNGEYLIGVFTHASVAVTPLREVCEQAPQLPMPSPESSV
jgi:hypothetical protein